MTKWLRAKASMWPQASCKAKAGRESRQPRSETEATKVSRGLLESAQRYPLCRPPLVTTFFHLSNAPLQ
ncbi:hypothetical protein J4Q44_G00336840 [Coregonus suidteri]|uniref:Uncharacterized protein n=1 Tax=Coregonus suidteri TaxID=861788 RepID=A0AAN8QDE4_9TELE